MKKTIFSLILSLPLLAMAGKPVFTMEAAHYTAQYETKVTISGMCMSLAECNEVQNQIVEVYEEQMPHMNVLEEVHGDMPDLEIFVNNGKYNSGLGGDIREGTKIQAGSDIGFGITVDTEDSMPYVEQWLTRCQGDTDFSRCFSKNVSLLTD